MPSRRSHSKSHHGCTQCKGRQIKCDEVRPICGSCRRKQLPCNFQSFAPQTSPQPSIADAILGHRDSFVLPLLDLELLHHWHTVTGNYLADAKPLQDVIPTVMPQEGLANPFLMHSILAVSALHRAHSAPLSHRQILCIRVSEPKQKPEDPKSDRSGRSVQVSSWGRLCREPGQIVARTRTLAALAADWSVSNADSNSGRTLCSGSA
ncbi:Zn(II)2Cys6 transcription factor domain-containing protein [Aspergillus fumigatus Af293]|uniref:C6 finger domain protein, putative n=1 Tax=Aspergillus fumigatus (strain ATCC MYA-4609 / CBS 101355 / FGSC A1100 / Af293) TaxID=330879 RepID=Q4WL70_ASPFU|nr:C6 finger domain protein, putative [Aspergillus fumigatus Af293]EAL89294.1 C6 finger domain protein, putative [Aspergillus fumigatus Af293]